MNHSLLDRLVRTRQQLAKAVSAGATAPRSGTAAAPRLEGSSLGPAAGTGPVDLLVTHNEVSERHGTGVLLRRIFLDEPAVASLRAVDLYGGEQDLGSPRLRLSLEGAGWTEVVAAVLRSIGNLDVRRILCVPYGPVEVSTALAARDVFGAPLCTWVMDDQNIEAKGLSDELLRRLFERSRLLLAIGPELADAYRAKFGRVFGLAPPVVSPAFLQAQPGVADAERLAKRRGLVFGNIWGHRWLESLLEVLDGSGVVLDWHSTGGTPWFELDEKRLLRAGLKVRPHLAEPDIVAMLRASPFVVITTGAFDRGDSHGFLARLSLPSRIPYVAATAGTPLLVLGHPDTAAGHFIARHGLGVVVPYDQRRFLAAVEEICRPEVQARCRANAAKLAPVFSGHGMLNWIWDSLEAGKVIDGRFDPLENSA